MSTATEPENKPTEGETAKVEEKKDNGNGNGNGNAELEACQKELEKKIEEARDFKVPSLSPSHTHTIYQA